MILGLIIMENNYFISLVNELLVFYGEEKKQMMQECFNVLMNNISPAYNNSTIESFKKELESFAEKILLTK